MSRAIDPESGKGGIAQVDASTRAVRRKRLAARTTTPGLRYAKNVKADPTKSLVGTQDGDAEIAARGIGDVPVMTVRQKSILAIVGLTFTFMIFAIVPWAQVINGPDAASFGWQLDWYFPELAALFIAMSIVVGLIGGPRRERYVGDFRQGRR